MPKVIPKDLENYLNSFSKPNDDISIEMEQFARENKIPILEKTSLKLLEQLIIISGPKRFLEIGTAIGYSTIRVAKMVDKQTEIKTIELSNHNIQLAEKYFKKSEFSERIELIEGDAIKYLRANEENFDFIFLDADKEDYPEYLELCIENLNFEGILFVDNLLWKGYVVSEIIPEEHKKSTEFIKKFNAQFLNHPKLNSSIIPIGDGVGIGIKTK